MRSAFYQIIQTLFAQNKRFAVLLLLMMNIAWIYAGDSYFRAKVDVKADPTGVGTVYVSRTSGEKTSQTAFGEYGKDGKYDHQTTFYFMADHENAEYLWYAWIANNKPVLREKNGSLTFDCSEAKRTEYGAGSNVTDKQSGNDSWYHFPFTFTANWVQPDVTGLTSGTTDGIRRSTYTIPTITTPTPVNATLTFTLSNDYAGLKDISDAEPANYYSIATALNANGYTNGALMHTKGSGNMTIPITYTPTGVHGQTNSASLAVKSNYPSSGANYWTVELNAKEDYKPSFTLDASYNFTPTQPISNSGSDSYTLPISNRNYAANNVSEWEFVWSSVTYAGGTYPNANPYSIDDTEINNPKVIITAPATGNYMDVTATLTIVAKYKDAGGNLISSEPKPITFSADFGNVLTINDVSEYTIDFGTVDFGTEYTDEVKFISTYADLTETVTNSVPGITFTSNALEEKIVVNIANTTAIGSYNPTLTISSGETSVLLHVKVQVKLATPTLSATVGIGPMVNLSWTDVYGATTYIIKSGETVVATIGDDEPLTTNYRVKTIGSTALKLGVEYGFTVTASTGSNTSVSSEVKATPTIYSELTFTTDFDIYTGTNAYKEGDEKYGKFPYSKPRKIDLTRAFDTSGMPLFDVLYIFGLTTNTSGGDEIDLPTSSVVCNAKTPLYVYRKSGDKYTYITEYDAVKKRFNHPSTVGEEESVNGRHLYFTGYCPFANIGVEADDEGWMYFVGGNTKVDIYLDDCTIIGRYRTVDGRTTGFKNKTVSLVASNFVGGENPNYLTGFSSVFVFESSSNNIDKPYKPTIHISGDNHLKGQIGYITSVVGNLLNIFDGIETGVGNVTTVSSPITIKPTSKGGYTDLTMDDLWPTKADYSTKEVTNGFLLLNTQEIVGSEKVPCVDLGSEYGSLTINGGQYMLRNSAADGTYTCNMAFSYRKFSKSVEKWGFTANLSLYGFGGDETKAPVRINGGTFNMYTNMYINGTDKVTNKPIYLGSNYYLDQENFLDLRLPAGDDSEPGRSSYINGGTFNGISHVVFCSQVTSSGKSPINHTEDVLCLQDVVIEGPNVDQNNGTVKFVVPEPFSDYYDETDDDKVGYNLSTGLDDVVECTLYGGQSANSYLKNIGGEYKNVVSVLLPAVQCEGATCTGCELFEEAIYYNWITAIPEFTISVAGQGGNIGGEAEVPISEGEATKVIVNQLLYTDLEGLEKAEIQGDFEISFANQSFPRGQLMNSKNYRIYKNLNILKSVEADRWYCFVAPYDIHEVSVIETAETTLAEAEYKNDRAKASNLQAQNNLKVLYELSHFILPDPNGRATSLTLNELLASKRVSLYHYNGLKEADENYGRPVMTANYYLYEITNNSGFDKTTTTNAKDTFHIEWTPVSRSAGEPLMRRGQVYAIQFPWCPMCNDLATRKYYDYWTNKMILFYGHGYDKPGTANDGQLIYGTTEQTTHNAVPEDGQAVYAGNYSFADMTAPTNAYVHDYDVDKEILDDMSVKAADWFIPAPSGHKVKPTEGFMLYKPGASPMPARISRTGQIEYDENVETGVGGVPTVGDRTSLMLYGAYDGFELLSLCEQLVTVYNLQGNIIFQQYMAEGQQVYVATGAGVFIVRGESETIKVMVE